MRVAVGIITATVKFFYVSILSSRIVTAALRGPAGPEIWTGRARSAIDQPSPISAILADSYDGGETSLGEWGNFPGRALSGGMSGGNVLHSNHLIIKGT